jgi:BirA family biotin operon repressor/biotin-[acetyl-CoA-carboxylase] ligase
MSDHQMASPPSPVIFKNFPMNTEYLKSSLVKEGMLSHVVYFQKLPSTNKYAKTLDAGDNILVITDFQEHGVGRFGRIWSSGSEEDITCTLVKNIKLDIDDIHLVNFYTSYILAVTLKSMNEFAAIDFKLKWPNDVLANGKKISGILTEVQHITLPEKRFIIGMGINVNTCSFPEQIKNKAASLYTESGVSVSREELLEAVIKNFYANLDLLHDRRKLISEWKKNSDIINKIIYFKELDDSALKPGKVLGINDDGGLVLECEGGSIKVYYSGEVSLSYN